MATLLEKVTNSDDEKVFPRHVAGIVDMIDGTKTDIANYSGIPGEVRSGAWTDAYIDSMLLTRGWLRCDGTAISRTTYADLFLAIGTGFGVGDGSTTFNLPLTSNKYAVGAGTTPIGSLVGANTHTHSHDHTSAPHVHAYNHEHTYVHDHEYSPLHEHTFTHDHEYDVEHEHDHTHDHQYSVDHNHPSFTTTGSETTGFRSVTDDGTPQEDVADTDHEHTIDAPDFDVSDRTTGTENNNTWTLVNPPDGDTSGPRNESWTLVNPADGDTSGPRNDAWTFVNTAGSGNNTGSTTPSNTGNNNQAASDGQPASYANTTLIHV